MIYPFYMLIYTMKTKGRELELPKFASFLKNIKLSEPYLILHHYLYLIC